MPVQITILSGARQGERLELTENSFDAGDRKGDAIYLDPVVNPGVKGRRASLRLEADGWRIRSTGSLPILLNHDQVAAPRPLRSGDIVRMSEDGPDFSFTLISRLSPATEHSPVASEKRGTGSTTPAASRAVADSSDSTLLSSSQRSLATVLLSLGVLAVIVAASVLILRPPTRRSLTGSNYRLPGFGHIPALPANEGKPLLWTPELVGLDFVSGDLVFSHDGPVPEGLAIEPETGTIRWTPTEAQGPGEYKCVLRATHSSSTGEGSFTGTVLIQVDEVNQPPVIAPLGMPTINLLEDRRLSLTIQATDPDLPSAELSYSLGPDHPSGMQLDQKSGLLTWEADDSYANREVPVVVQVSDNAAHPLTTSATLRIRVASPNPWDVAESKVRESLYLIAARTTTNSLVPLGTACAIRDDTLLTSATVASAAETARKNDWPIVALTPEQLKSPQPQGLPISDLQVHVGYVQAQDPVQQSYFDLALLTTSDKLPATCRLADAADKLVNGEQVAGLGFTIEGGALTRFDRPAPALHQVELYSVIPFETGEAADEMLLLQLRGDLPEHLFGSPIVNHAGEVLGIYAFEGELPAGENSPPIHYGPVITLANAWLSGSGRDHWVAPPAAAAVNSDNPTP